LVFLELNQTAPCNLPRGQWVWGLPLVRGQCFVLLADNPVCVLSPQGRGGGKGCLFFCRGERGGGSHKGHGRTPPHWLGPQCFFSTPKTLFFRPPPNSHTTVLTSWGGPLGPFFPHRTLTLPSTCWVGFLSFGFLGAVF